MSVSPPPALPPDFVRSPSGAVLREFVADVFSSLGRRDRRDTAALYLAGLTSGAGRRSMTSMAQHLGVDHQRLQQFVTSSPWPVEPVREAIARRVDERLGPGRGAPDAWLVGDTSFVKDGSASAAVERQYSSALRKVVNCQVAVSVHAVAGRAAVPVNWRLFVPPGWDTSAARSSDEQAAIVARRRRCAMPDGERYRPRWQVAVEMIDELIGWGRTPPVIVAAPGFGESESFRRALAHRGCGYVVAVDGATVVRRAETPGADRQSPSRSPQRRDAWTTCSRAILTAPDTAVIEAAGARFVATRVRPAAAGAAAPADTERLLAEWPASAEKPTRFWLAALPDGTAVAELVRYAQLSDRAAAHHRHLADTLGLHHFEGRSWLGWHHHVTLVAAAQLLLTEHRPETDARGSGDGPRRAQG